MVRNLTWLWCVTCSRLDLVELIPLHSQCNAAYHHFPDIEAVTKTLASYLEPGGVLIVCDNEEKGKDIASSGTTSEEAKKSITHPHGFSEETVKNLFEGAGLVDFKMEHATSVKYDSLDFGLEIFIARATKPEI